MKPFEYVLAAGLLIAAFFIVPWSYNHWMQATTQSPNTANAVNVAPTISASQIDQVLCSTKSPACGTGSDLYTYGAQYGIDPAFAMAVFHHESKYGTLGIATQTHSLGNLRCIPGYACQDGYASFSTWSEGYTAFYKLISGPLYVGAGLVTPEQIMPRYAPVGDNNDPSQYAASVEQMVAALRKAA